MVAVDSPLRMTGDGPNSSIAIASAGGFASTKPRAAAIASANGRPLIDCESSTARTTALDRPRFCAVRPIAGRPFSYSWGVTASPADDTTVTWIVGNECASTFDTSTDAAAGAATTSAAASAAADIERRRFIRLL